MSLSKFRNIQQINTQSANKQKGFTLIELVVVIVILGILAVTAAPKFIDLTSDARAAVVEAVKGSINSAADMAHSKALVSGQTSETGEVTVGDTAITLRYGWPANASMADLLELDADVFIEVSTSAGTFEHADATDGTECRAVYDSSTIDNLETRPSISSETDKC
jgi:MSHA pilin protein MshA